MVLFVSWFWHLSWWNSVWKITYRESRKTTVPSRLTTTASVLQERMKYPNNAYWAIPTAKNKPPIDPSIQLETKQNIITPLRNITDSQHMVSDWNEHFIKKSHSAIQAKPQLFDQRILCPSPMQSRSLTPNCKDQYKAKPLFWILLTQSSCINNWIL